MSDASETAESCRTVADVARGAIGWFEDPANADKVGAERKGIVRDLRRAGARAAKLGRAVERPMCVGVFGPSQAGKSFLVSVLARPPEGRLRAKFEGHPDGVDFISQINPEGEGESTGLVTRFTVRPYTHPPGYPVRLRLLSEADLIRILANTFLMDGDLSEPPPEPKEIEELMQRFRGRTSDAPSGLTTELMWEVQDYFEKQFQRIAYVAALLGYWDEAAELAPRLALDDRAEFLSLLWGRHPKLTDLYRRLVGALERLGFADEAFAPLAALLPRETSLIDVATLAGLDGGSFGDLELKTATTSASLPRPMVTALTAELQILMVDKPYDLFDHTDLLDFPGARSRFKESMQALLVKGEAPLKETFLRGKVAYLFDRYVAEQELTSMLLCLPDSNLEVIDLPGLVEDWIANTHGRTPAERASSTCILFFVLTKFDKHLIDSGGSGDDPASRFQKRMNASLIAPFGRMPESWPKRWTPDRPFTNCFWLRNPNYPAEAVIEYEQITDEKGRVRLGRELRILAAKKERVGQLRDGCINAIEVQTHFADPERAWDAAMALNDGGVSYLVEGLRPVCRPAMKAEQVRGQLRTLVQTVASRLERFYVSSDVEKRLAERRAVGAEIIQGLYACFDAGRFGRLFLSLMVDPSQLADHFFHIKTEVASAPAARGPGVSRPQPAGAMSGGRPLPGAALQAARPLPGAAPAANAAVLAPRPAHSSRSDRLAQAAIGFWLEALHREAAQERLAERLHFEPRLYEELVTELAAGGRRLDRAAAIARAIEAAEHLDRGEVRTVKPALLAAHLLNGFVARLGFDAVPLEARPTVDFDGGSRPVFAPEPVRFDASDLPAEPPQYADRFMTDWAFAFFRLLEDNAKTEDGGVLDIEQNSRLGTLLTTIEPFGGKP